MLYATPCARHSPCAKGGGGTARQMPRGKRSNASFLNRALHGSSRRRPVRAATLRAKMPESATPITIQLSAKEKPVHARIFCSPLWGELSSKMTEGVAISTEINKHKRGGHRPPLWILLNYERAAQSHALPRRSRPFHAHISPRPQFRIPNYARITVHLLPALRCRAAARRCPCGTFQGCRVGAARR